MDVARCAIGPFTIDALSGNAQNIGEPDDTSTIEGPGNLLVTDYSYDGFGLEVYATEGAVRQLHLRIGQGVRPKDVSRILSLGGLRKVLGNEDELIGDKHSPSGFIWKEKSCSVLAFLENKQLTAIYMVSRQKSLGGMGLNRLLEARCGVQGAEAWSESEHPEVTVGNGRGPIEIDLEEGSIDHVRIGESMRSIRNTWGPISLDRRIGKRGVRQLEYRQLSNDMDLCEKDGNLIGFFFDEAAVKSEGALAAVIGHDAYSLRQPQLGEEWGVSKLEERLGRGEIRVGTVSSAIKVGRYRSAGEVLVWKRNVYCIAAVLASGQVEGIGVIARDEALVDCDVAEQVVTACIAEKE